MAPEKGQRSNGVYGRNRGAANGRNGERATTGEKRWEILVRQPPGSRRAAADQARDGMNKERKG
jgi:hypothetical protein